MGGLYVWCIDFAVCGGQQRLYSSLFGKTIQAQIRGLFSNQALANPTFSNETLRRAV